MPITRRPQPQKKPKKLTTYDMEIAVAHNLGVRRNLVVPNVSWGLFRHECDLISMSQAGYFTEVEIKITKADLKADKKKLHDHTDPKIKYLYFAIPVYLKDSIDLIPERAGIYTVERVQSPYYPDWKYKVLMIRGAEQYGDYKATVEDRIQLARLGAMRIWGLKEKVVNLREENSSLHKWRKSMLKELQEKYKKIIEQHYKIRESMSDREKSESSNFFPGSSKWCIRMCEEVHNEIKKYNKDVEFNTVKTREWESSGKKNPINSFAKACAELEMGGIR